MGMIQAGINAGISGTAFMLNLSRGNKNLSKVDEKVSGVNNTMQQFSKLSAMQMTPEQRAQRAQEKAKSSLASQAYYRLAQEDRLTLLEKDLKDAYFGGNNG